MNRDRPILPAIVWTVVGFANGIAAMLAYNALWPSKSTLNDQALDQAEGLARPVYAYGVESFA
jgi:hypothetical protein